MRLLRCRAAELLTARTAPLPGPLVRREAMAEAERAGGVAGDLERELTCSVSCRRGPTRVGELANGANHRSAPTCSSSR